VIKYRETLPFMIAKLQCVVLDCADVVELSRFYQSLLGGVVNQPDPRWSLGDGWATLLTDLNRAQEGVLNLGATLLDEGDGKRSWRIFADPAGHPFCLVRD
jgi:hypothetical protein